MTQSMLEIFRKNGNVRAIGLTVLAVALILLYTTVGVGNTGIFHVVLALVLTALWVGLILGMSRAVDWSRERLGGHGWKLIWLVANILAILLFAVAYWTVPSMKDTPLDHATGQQGQPVFNSFYDAIYFSATVQFTVGFGDMSPKCNLAKRVAVIQYFTSFYINVLEVVNPTHYGAYTKK